MTDLAFLIWLHERLVMVHKENPNVDYMHKFRSIIATIPVDQITPNSISISLAELEAKK